MMTHFSLRSIGFALAIVAFAATQAHPQDPPTEDFDVRDEMIPMRDGIKLHTKIYIPKDRRENLPIIMNRTPYGVARAGRHFQTYFKALADEGYIFAFQDI